MPAPDELNDRQQELIAQVQSGGVTEELPDTEEQLLRLAQLGHLEAEHDADDWHFTIPDTDVSEPEPETDLPEE